MGITRIALKLVSYYIIRHLNRIWFYKNNKKVYINNLGFKGQELIQSFLYIELSYYLMS